MILFFKQLYRDALLIINIIFNNNYFFEKTKSQSQNQKNIFVEKISRHIKNKFFLEIGFHYSEFNFFSLIKNGFNGILVDADSNKNIFFTKLIIFLIKKKITVLKKFITLNNIIDIFPQKNIGALSIDIDGNDFWVLKKILDNKIYPEVIVVEYNSSFLKKSIAIEYKENFNRFLYHSSGFYHSASLSAFCKILKEKNYYLVKVINGLNACFVNSEILHMAQLEEILPENVNDHNLVRAKISNLDPIQQFEKIKHLTFVEI
jgi:hypothetical protein